MIVETVAPTTTPVTLELTKQYLRVITDDENDLITTMIYAAAEYMFHARGRSLCTHTLRYTVDVPEIDNIVLPGLPITTVTSVTVTNLSDDTTDSLVEDTDYTMNLDTGKLTLLSDGSWGDGTEITVVYVAGQVSIDDETKLLVMAVIQYMYDNREMYITGNLKLNEAIERSMWHKKVIRFA